MANPGFMGGCVSRESSLKEKYRNDQQPIIPGAKNPGIRISRKSWGQRIKEIPGFWHNPIYVP